MTKRTVAVPSDGTAHSTSALSALFDQLVRGRKYTVLDLGPALGINVDFWSQIPCKIYIQDFYRSLHSSEVGVRGEGDAGPEVLARLLPAAAEGSVDIVLCWDLLNYLNRPALTAVMECIAARGRPGTLVHALVYYAARQMPERPSCFLPLDEQRLEIVPQKVPLRAAPRYSPEDLATCMPRYSVDRARLLRNGMQEFLFRL